MQGKPLSDDARRIILLMAISHQLSAEDISTWTGEQFSALSQHIELGHDTSADCLQVLTGKPVGKLTGGECGCTRHSFPTGMPRVRVVVFGSTSLTDVCWDRSQPFPNQIGWF